MIKNYENGTSILPYNGTNITFELANGDIMVNLTEMGKAFAKRPIDFLRLPSTNELIKAIVRKSHISENQLVTTIQGSSENGGGTWANRLVALSFAQWLSVDFHLLCLEKIEELLQQGYTKVDSISKKDLAKMLLESEEEKERLERKANQLEYQNEAQSQMLEARDRHIQFLMPGATFANAVKTSECSVLVGDLARIIKQNGVEIGQNRLFQWMRKNGFLISRAGESYNLPTQKGLNMGLFEIKKTVITKPDGTSLVTTTPKVTGKGQVYFVNKFLYDSINEAELEKQKAAKKGGLK